MHPQLAFEFLDYQTRHQANALKELLQYLQQHSPFYKKLFLTQQLKIEEIKTLEDLSKIPTTGKHDIQNKNWDFLCVAKKDIREYTSTSGTLGKPVTIALTANDLIRLAYNEQQSFLTANAKPDDIFQLMLTLDRQFMAGMAYYQGINNIGGGVVRTGPGLPSLQWETIQRLNVNSIVAVPSFILKLIDFAKENKIDINNSSVCKAICIGENLREQNFELNALGKRIKHDWNIDLYTTYASTEMQTAFTECEHGNGGHEQPDLIITEILDEEGNVLKEGEYGEVAITTLGIEAMPLLRYRTGDIACLYKEPCACGRKSKRISALLGRKLQMIKYKGTTLYPTAIFDVLNEIGFVNEYVVEVVKDEIGNDAITLYINSEREDEVFVKNLLRSKIRVVPAIRFLSLNEVTQMQYMNASRKPVKFVDRRN